jgi:hypothetical protein
MNGLPDRHKLQSGQFHNRLNGFVAPLRTMSHVDRVCVRILFILTSALIAAQHFLGPSALVIQDFHCHLMDSKVIFLLITILFRSSLFLVLIV